MAKKTAKRYKDRSAETELAERGAGHGGSAAAHFFFLPATFFAVFFTGFFADFLDLAAMVGFLLFGLTRFQNVRLSESAVDLSLRFSVM